MCNTEITKIAVLVYGHIYIRPHQINFLADGFSAEKNGASKQIFFSLIFFFNPPKNGASEEALFFFSFKKKLISRKNGASEKAIFFQKKGT